MSGAKSEPRLTQLRERLCKYDGFSMYRAEFDCDISLAWQRDDDGLVSKWTLEIVGLGTYAANVSSRTDDALADVNAILARYAYVLEAWP